MRLRALFVVIFMLLLVNFIVSAQEESPTPAPSKTPEAETTEIVAEATEDANATAFDSTELARAFTQEDLNVLVGNVQRPNGLVWFDDKLYTACTGDWTLYEIDAVTGATRSLVIGIRNAHALYPEVTDAGYNLWIPDFELNQFMRVDQRLGAPRTIESDNLNGPWGIAAITDELFLISNVRENNIILADREGNSRPVMTGLRSPAGLANDGDFVYVANNGSARRAIEWFSVQDLPAEDNDDPVEGVTQPLVQGLQNVSSVVMGQDGYLYFSYALGTRGVVGRVAPEECRDGGCTNDQVEIVIFSDLQAPLAGLTISDDMRIFMHTIFEPQIYWVSLYE